ncbi:MAG: hypothetical protein Q7R56_01060 [Nanoarchaeota archaeon]|nr:hypothetical protein [Nanoarchaeota archaeon]
MALDQVLLVIVIMVVVWMLWRSIERQKMLEDRARKGGLMVAAKHRAAKRSGGKGSIRKRPAGRKILKS